MLHPGVLKLAGSVLSHRLVDEAERSVVGSNLLLSNRQHEDLAKLSSGQVVMYSAGRTASVAVDVSASDLLIRSMKEERLPDAPQGKLPMVARHETTSTVNQVAFLGLKRQAVAMVRAGRNPWEIMRSLTGNVLDISSNRDEAEHFLVRLSRTVQQARRQYSQGSSLSESEGVPGARYE